MILPDSFGLYFITDRKLTKKTIMIDVASALRAGVRIIQYREKELSTKEMYQEASALKELTEENNAILIINDRIDIALAVNADGIHIGQDDMPFEKARELLGKEKIIGLTVHNIEEVTLGEVLGADYFGISPIFSTTTKRDAGKPTGLEFIKEVAKKTKIPFVAIGGINYDNLEAVLVAGARNVAVISAIITKDDVEAECRKFMRKIATGQPD